MRWVDAQLGHLLTREVYLLAVLPDSVLISANVLTDHMLWLLFLQETISRLFHFFARSCCFFYFIKEFFSLLQKLKSTFRLWWNLIHYLVRLLIHLIKVSLKC